MTAPKRLDDEHRRRLLNDLVTLRLDDDDAFTQSPLWFLPLDAHTRALRLETLVVRGGRGAGKSALFHFLGHVQKNPALVRSLVDIQQLTSQIVWLDGFGSLPPHPPLDLVGEFDRTASDDTRRFFWFAWLCVRLSTATKIKLPDGLSSSLIADLNPTQLAAVGGRDLSKLSAWMDQVEQDLASPVVIIYDSLDRIGSVSATRQRMTASLLAMWLSLADRYRKIRPKIFVREDLFHASLSTFPDASKLDARSVSLEWRVEDLYRVLIKHMANISPELREWIQGSSRRIRLKEIEGMGWMPPQSLPETGPESQKGFVDHLAGELMGSGPKKGLTYHWIPNRLQDAHARAVPRSFIALVRNAANFALQKGPGAQNLRLLTPPELQGALENTSLRRVNELREEFPVVGRLEHLRGETVMLARKAAVTALSKSDEEDKDRDEYGGDGERVLQALIDLGVMSERDDGRIDVPDIYRYGFGILRKGGVKRPR